ncbi:MAG: hypothetical protein HC828_21375 [Blastochloris sp.]|nr:hypothetical protein [Blastochloris sp.]
MAAASGTALAVVKAQVHAGGRGKAASSKLVRNDQEATEAARFMLTNRIEAFEPAGFRVGDHNEVDRNNDAFFYVAFGNGSKPSLVVAETSTRITVTSPAYFEMSFDTAAGGGVQEFFDLASGENSDLDLAGGIDGIEAPVVQLVEIRRHLVQFEQDRRRS